MRENWLAALTKNPLTVLKDWPEEALTYFVKRDLKGKKVENVEILWGLPEVSGLVRKQRADGSWKYPGRTQNLDTGQNSSLLETFRNLLWFVVAKGITVIWGAQSFTRKQKA
jgi:hypothetical protein